MSTVDVHGNRPSENVALGSGEVHKSMEVVAGGSTAEAVGGAAAVVLGILGLAQILPLYMAAIAAIAVGAALVFEGGAIAARYSRIIRETSGGKTSSAEIGSGMSTEFLGGVAGIVLGILALLGIIPEILLAVAAIVFGGTLLLSSGATSRLNSLAYYGLGGHQGAQEMAREAVMGAAGAQVLVGLGSAVLGILALVGFQPLLLTLVAFLSVGASVLLSGSTLTARMLGALYR